MFPKKSSRRQILIIFSILIGMIMHADPAMSKPNKLIRHFPVRLIEGDWEVVGFYSRTLDVNKIPIYPGYWNADGYFVPGTRVRFVFSKDQAGYYSESIAVYEMTLQKPYPRLLCEHSFYAYLCKGLVSEARHIELSAEPVNPNDWESEQYEYAPVGIRPRFSYFLGGPPQGSAINSYLVFEGKDKFYLEQNFFTHPANDSNERHEKKIKIAGTVGLIFQRIK